MKERRTILKGDRRYMVVVMEEEEEGGGGERMKRVSSRFHHVRKWKQKASVRQRRDEIHGAVFEQKHDPTWVSFVPNQNIITRDRSTFLYFSSSSPPLSFSFVRDIRYSYFIIFCLTSFLHLSLYRFPPTISISSVNEWGRSILIRIKDKAKEFQRNK